uniref:Capsid protein n=1 Tax=Nandayus nenday Chaphamaparvovirus TaxID=2794493 RepID=A0A8A4XDS6_9VIRU|nr:MAG: capsid protein [Nandayus nenday Chaphamaparvovirus]
MKPYLTFLYMYRYQTNGNNTYRSYSILMAEDFVIENTYMAYISNAPYVYPNDSTDKYVKHATISTGWHVIPNQLWRHVATPKDWYHLQINAEAYHVKSQEITVFNMVPMTTQLAIQGNTLFTAFNNTIYALAYTDDLYETGYEPWRESNDFNVYSAQLAWKEGQRPVYKNTSSKRNDLPKYNFLIADSLTTSSNTWSCSNQDAGQGCWPSPQRPTGLFWDPLNRPENIQELRPGKNAVHFTWHCHETDSNIWFNMDGLAHWYPNVPTGPYGLVRPRVKHLGKYDDPNLIATQLQQTPNINDYSLPNFNTVPITPNAWFWKELQQSLVDTDLAQKPNLHFPGTEYEQYKYPIMQHFIKMIPLFDPNNVHIEITANVSIKIKTVVSYKKRRSAIFAPTWGPFNWRSLYSSAIDDGNFMPSMIRYRTAGARRTWQNIAVDQLDSDDSTTFNPAHPRQTPYYITTQAVGPGLDGTLLSTQTQTARPQATKRKTQPTTSQRDPSPEMPINQPAFDHITKTQL